MTNSGMRGNRGKAGLSVEGEWTSDVEFAGFVGHGIRLAKAVNAEEDLSIEPLKEGEEADCAVLFASLIRNVGSLVGEVVCCVLIVDTFFVGVVGVCVGGFTLGSDVGVGNPVVVVVVVLDGVGIADK